MAPLKIKYQKPKSEPWVNEAVREIRRTCRQAKRKWKKDKLQVSYELLRDALSKFQWAMSSAKSKYFADLIERNCNNCNINVGLNPAISMPHQYESFFVNKIRDIRLNIMPVISDPAVPPVCHVVFNQFTVISLLSF